MLALSIPSPLHNIGGANGPGAADLRRGSNLRG